MTMLTSVLILSVIALTSYSYLKVLYNSKRRIQVRRTYVIKGLTDEPESETIAKYYPQAPGPKLVWPILGNLVDFGKYQSPSIAFTELAKKYGDIYSMTLGSSRCLVVNNLDMIREVLNQNGKYFGARPNFLRFHRLFGGDRSNCKF